MSKRLTDNHPLKKKFNALEQFMSDNDIQLGWDGYHMNFTDTKTGESATIRDIDDGQDITDVPYLTECKLVID